MKFYSFEEFHKQEMDTPNRYNEVYLALLDELWQKYPELHKPGIYGIYFKKQLVYIGKATDIAKRWVSHCFNWTHDFSESYYTSKYTALRNLSNLGEIDFRVIHPLDQINKSKLDALEAHYIRLHMPLLNRQIPNASGRGYKEKYFTIRELMETTGLSSEQAAGIKAELIKNKRR